MSFRKFKMLVWLMGWTMRFVSLRLMLSIGIGVCGFSEWSLKDQKFKCHKVHEESLKK